MIVNQVKLAILRSFVISIITFCDVFRTAQAGIKKKDYQKKPAKADSYDATCASNFIWWRWRDLNPRPKARTSQISTSLVFD